MKNNPSDTTRRKIIDNAIEPKSLIIDITSNWLALKSFKISFNEFLSVSL